jgi:hypothetical protein
MKRLLFLIAFFPRLSFADVDFYTYGGFTTVVNGYKYMVDVFDSSSYSILVFVVLMLSILISALVNTGKGLMGKGSASELLSAFFLSLFGFTVYQATIIPTTTVHIYDTVLNQYEAVNGVPMLIANIAGAINVLERVGNETFTGSTMNRDTHGAGATVQLLSTVMSSNSLKYEPYLEKSIAHYLDRCMPPALTSSTGDYGTFNLSTILQSALSLVDELAKLSSSFQLTLYYDVANKQGINVTCATAWTNISTLITQTTTYDKHYFDACKRQGFKDDAAGIAACKSRIVDVASHLLSPSVTIDESTIAANQALAKSLYHNLSHNPALYMSDMIDMKAQISGLSSMVAAAGWLPTIRYSTMMIIVGIIPFLALMLATPMFAKALKYIAGLLLFTTIWAICDTAIHGITVASIQEQMSLLTSSRFSVNTFMTAPTELQKALATIGKMQSMGLGLAAVLMGVFFGISGHAFASMGQKIQGDIDSLGKDTGMEALNPNQRQSTIDNYASTVDKSQTMRDMGSQGYLEAQGSTATQGAKVNREYMDDMMKNHGIAPQEAMSMQAQVTAAQQSGHMSELMNTDVHGKPASVGDVQSEMTQMQTRQQIVHLEATESTQVAVSEMNGQTRTDNAEAQATQSLTQALAANEVTKLVQAYNGDPNLLQAAKSQQSAGVNFVADEQTVENAERFGTPVNDASKAMIEEHGSTVATASFNPKTGQAFNFSTSNNNTAFESDQVTSTGGFQGARGTFYDSIKNDDALSNVIAGRALSGDDTETELAVAEQLAGSTLATNRTSDTDSSDASVTAGASVKVDLAKAAAGGIGKILEFIPGGEELPDGIGGKYTSGEGKRGAFAETAGKALGILKMFTPEVHAGANYKGTNSDVDSRAIENQALFQHVTDSFQEEYKLAQNEGERFDIEEQYKDVQTLLVDAINLQATELAKETLSDIETDVPGYDDNFDDILDDLNKPVKL